MGAIRQIKQLLDETEVRLFAVIRDPVQRFVSFFNMLKKNLKKNKTDAELNEDMRAIVKSSQQKGWLLEGEYQAELTLWLQNFPKSSLLAIDGKKLLKPLAWK